MYKYIFKRMFDFVASFFGLIFLSPIIFICWLTASLEVKGNGFFFQKRVGYKGKVFNVIKIKTMFDSDISKSSITCSNDSSITRSGRFFRKAKLDELPQLFNVLTGSMSLVGPRPDVPGYADDLHGEDREILMVRPGITGPAQIYFKDEELLLSKQPNPKEYNDNIIWPQKVEVNKLYVKKCSFSSDIQYIFSTIFK